METKDQNGQVLIEVCLVVSLILLVGFAALTQLAKLEKENKKFQLTEDGRYAKKMVRTFKK